MKSDFEGMSFDFDELKMYFGEDYEVNDQITIHIPTLQEIIDFGEKKMYSSISMFTCNPTSYRVLLWEKGFDWNKVSDYELFIMLISASKKEDTKLIFGDVDFASLSPVPEIANLEELQAYEEKHRAGQNVEETEESESEDSEESEEEIPPEPKIRIVLKNEDESLIIDELIYLRIREFIRKMFNIYPKVEGAEGKITKQWIIEEDKQKLLETANNEDASGSSSMLLPMISALINHPGFKYNLQELKDVNIVQFMDSVQRLQVYESSVAFMHGMCSGMMDTSKMSADEKNSALNWMQDLSKLDKKSNKNENK